MKQQAFIFFSAMMLCNLSLNAILPPLYASLTEYQALVTSPELTDKLGSAEGILDIKRTEKGFSITSFKYTLDVDLVSEHQDQPGPSKFHFVFHELEKR
jgi:hypothetical protein